MALANKEFEYTTLQACENWERHAPNRWHVHAGWSRQSTGDEEMVRKKRDLVLPPSTGVA